MPDKERSGVSPPKRCPDLKPVDVNGSVLLSLMREMRRVFEGRLRVEEGSSHGCNESHPNEGGDVVCDKSGCVPAAQTDRLLAALRNDPVMMP